MTWILKNWDIVAVSVCLFMYAGTAILRGIKGDLPTALVFAAYALANVGFIWQFQR